MKSKPTYINTDFNFDTAIGASIIDEAPLWSAPFGLKLFEKVRYRKNITILDIGFGTGFPLFELASRLGNTCKCYGIDIWNPSHTRLQQKIKFYGTKNIFPIKGTAEKIPLKNNSVDLIISCNGFNNIENLDEAFAECSRITRKGAQLLFTHNTAGTFRLFYDTFIGVLEKNKMQAEILAVKKHIRTKRRPFRDYQKLLTENNFKIISVANHKFEYHFTDAKTFFSHHLIRLGFLSSWHSLVPERKRKKIFSGIVKELNKTTPIKMSVPFVVIDSKKI